MSARDSDQFSAPPSTMDRAWRRAVLVCGTCGVVAECLRWSNPEARIFALFGCLCGEQADWLPFLPWLMVALVVGLRGSQAKPLRGECCQHSQTMLAASATILVGTLALLMSQWVGSHFNGPDGRPFPPAYHDEYSYLFQAQTFLAGRTWFPSFEPRPELFDQMHVLNLGRFASRYFPGVGVWLAPFVALGDPWLAQSVAQACCAVMLCWIGRELRDWRCGLIAGGLFAVSPGLAFFSTLLVAHHPTLLGILAFLWAFLRLMRRADPWMALMSGTALAYAMLCRPMTAAGFALPFGAWLAWYLASGGRQPAECAPPVSERFPATAAQSAGVRPPLAGATFSQRLPVGVSMAMPLAAGMAVLLWYSWTITGDPFVSPYQLYTDEYTPRHVYGFNNVARGEQHLGPHVVQNYDEWAANLTPRLAVANSWRRLLASLRLTLGIVPILFAVLFLLISGGLRGPLLLIALSIVSLFAVHVPYWFVGIMEWHYVLEASPLWLLLVGAATSDLWACCRSTGRWSRGVCWFGMLSTAVAINTVHVPLVTDTDGTWWLWRARLPRLVSEMGYARSRYAAVVDQVEQLRGGRPAVLLVIADPADRSLDYVTNSPTLDAPVLRVRAPAGAQDASSLAGIAALFPSRLPLVFDTAAGTLRMLPSATPR